MFGGIVHMYSFNYNKKFIFSTISGGNPQLIYLISLLLYLYSDLLIQRIFEILQTLIRNLVDDEINIKILSREFKIQ